MTESANLRAQPFTEPGAARVASSEVCAGVSLHGPQSPPLAPVQPHLFRGFRVAHGDRFVNSGSKGAGPTMPNFLLPLPRL
jgi:hypothetical protein